jgi:two-component system LytT family response regulator
MKKIRALIVDDERLARDGIAMMLEADGDVEVIGTCADGEEALAMIRTKQPDLVYLDVQMPRLNGFEALEQLPPGRCPTVIFVTAYDHYAIRAFEAAAVGYLLKPFRDARFREALGRAKQQIRYAGLDDVQRQAKQLSERLRDLEEGRAPVRASPVLPGRLTFKVGGDYLFVEADDIVWVEAQGEFIRICSAGQIHRVRESLQSLEQRLDPARYARIHRSFIVNMARIRRITPTLYGDYAVAMSDGAKVRLSRSYRHKLKTLLPEHFC